MREKARKSRTCKKDEEGHSGSVWNHRIPVIDNTRKKWPSFRKRVTSITKAQQSFISIHGGIPCNLAPAHFTVHVVQVRLNFALGFVVEANPAWDLFDLLHLYVICISCTLRRLARFRAGGGKSDPPPALSALLSYRSVHEGVRRKLLAPGRISLSEKYYRRNSKFYTVFFS